MSRAESDWLDLVAEDPEGDAPRFAYADRLAEWGDPRGLFVRLQCLLARLAADDPAAVAYARRAESIFAANGAAWTAAVSPYFVGCAFRRGLLDSITLTARQFLDHADRIFEAAPVRRVRLLESGGAEAVFHSPHLARVRELDLCGAVLGNALVQRLCRSDRLSALEELDLGFNELDDRAVETLATAAPFDRLRSLKLNDNPDIRDAKGLERLYDAAPFRGLQSLDVSGNQWWGGYWTQSPIRDDLLPELRELELHHNPVGYPLAERLLPSAFGQRVFKDSARLNLSACALDANAIHLLGESPALQRLSDLNLNDNMLGDAGVRLLATGRAFQGLRLLHLADNRITDDGIIDLARSPMLKTLRFIDVSGNMLSAEALILLRDASLAADWRRPLSIRAENVSPLKRVSRRMLRLLDKVRDDIPAERLYRDEGEADA